jgi:SAM-dependent methyltransferase
MAYWDERNALNLLNQEFPEFAHQIIGKAVIDFGCGEGWQSIAMARAGARYVLGVDTNATCLKRAQSLAARFDLPRDRIDFVRSLPADSRGRFELAISQNSFEHFPDPALVLQEIASALRPGGDVFITFGPPWLAPYGSHMYFFTRVPWVNILFAEATVMRARTRFRADGAVRYEEVEGGLNRMTIARFERLVRDSGLRLEWKRYRCVKGANALRLLPGLRELFINHVSCVLRKEGRARAPVLSSAERPT